MSWPYGEGHAFFHAAGGVSGIRKLIDIFYDVMEERPEPRAAPQAARFDQN